MSELYLVRLPISLPALARWASLRSYGWTIRKDSKGRERDAGLDEGRALHHLLVETYGPKALHPFRLMVAPQAKRGQVYAYSQEEATSLRETAQACALPEATEICDLSQLVSKRMPLVWRTGRRLGFEVRVRPVSRLLKPLPSSGGSFAKGAELDTFLVEALRSFPSESSSEESMLRSGRSREAVYTEWLAQKLAGAATLIERVRLTRFMRQSAARKGPAIEGPDATLQGDLTIDNPERFAELLRLGVGRHKAYGYGMVLVRPSRES